MEEKSDASNLYGYTVSVFTYMVGAMMRRNVMILNIHHFALVSGETYKLYPSLDLLE